MTFRTYDFGYPGYGPFTQTVAPVEINSSYTRNGGVLQERDVFLGGTSNLYDGTPTMIIRFEHQTNSSGQVSYVGGPNTLLGFTYDDKKRLIPVDYFAKLLPYSPSYSYEKVYYKTMLKMTYDANDNVTKLQQIDVSDLAATLYRTLPPVIFIIPKKLQRT